MLIGEPLVAQIFVGIEQAFTDSVGEHPLKTLSLIKQELEPQFKDYQLDLYISSTINPAPIILNAHLNFQPIAYNNGVISYPFLLTKISSELSRISTLIRQNPALLERHTYQENTVLDSIERYNRYSNACNKFRLIKEIVPPHIISIVNYGNKIQYKLMSKRGETLMLASDAIDTDTFKVAITSLNLIERKADALACQDIDQLVITRSEYGLTQIPPITPTFLEEHPEAGHLIDKETNRLSAQDSEGTIVDLKLMLREHFIRCYQQGLIFHAHEKLEFEAT